MVRLASAADATAIAELLHAFNAEYDEPAPEVPVLAERLAPMLASGR